LVERREEALNAYNTAITLNPAQAQSWFNMGTVLIEEERYEDALQALDAALDLCPDEPEVWNNRGAAL